MNAKNFRKIVAGGLLMLPLIGNAGTGNFSGCEGDAAKAVWALWDDSGRTHARDVLIGQRLLGKGDTYALYDLEIAFHNLLAMADRCKRRDRLLQFAHDWGAVYRKLEAVPLPASVKGMTMFAKDAWEQGALPPASHRGRVWICRGGDICNSRNGLANTEVMLVSVQGLGLLTHLANALSRSGKNDEVASRFVATTLDTSSEHLRRWGDAAAIEGWERAAATPSSAIRDGSSALLFTDHSFWQIAVYADMAGILQRYPHLRRSGAGATPDASQLRAIRALLKFFNARISLHTVDSAATGRTLAADLDRGYWRNFPDNRFAGYAGKEKPVACFEGKAGTELRYAVPLGSIAPVGSLGWDISHARRLIHVLDALDRNRDAMKEIYGLSDAELPRKGIAKLFAAQLAAVVWNGDARKPLFRNWLNGSNGWYRVGYDDGTPRCMEGYPPFGLSNAFPTGGYTVWAHYYPSIGRLGKTIFEASRSAEPDDRAFIRTYYPNLEFRPGDRPSRAQMLDRIMFWPALVAGISEPLQPEPERQILQTRMRF